METRREKAKEYFLKGYNCSQAICLAFADKTGIDEKTIAKLSSSFGGGMGRMREVCGAVSGMFIVIGCIYGYSDPETGKIKAEHYARIRELAQRFEDENGSIICRKLLSLDSKPDSPIPEARTPEYYKKRPCANIVYSAAAILEDYLDHAE